MPCLAFPSSLHACGAVSWGVEEGKDKKGKRETREQGRDTAAAFSELHAAALAPSPPDTGGGVGEHIRAFADSAPPSPQQSPPLTSPPASVTV